jgi:hypothetical protein
METRNNRWGWKWWLLGYALLACGVFVGYQVNRHWRAEMETKAAAEMEAKAVDAIEIVGGRVFRDKHTPGLPVVSIDLCPEWPKGYEIIRFLPESYYGQGATDVEMVWLERFCRLRDLDLHGTRVSDAGLVHLEGMTELRKLDVRGTKVTAAGVARLRKALPEADITWP